MGLLAPYVQNEAYGPTHPEPPPDDVEGHPEWEVQDIRSSRLRRNGKCPIEYLVAWKGYTEAYNTWEPGTNVWPHALRLVQRFHQHYPEKPSLTKRQFAKFGVTL